MPPVSQLILMLHPLSQPAQFDAPAPLPAGAATLDAVAEGVRRLLDVFVSHGFCTKASAHVQYCVGTRQPICGRGTVSASLRAVIQHIWRLERAGSPASRMDQGFWGRFWHACAAFMLLWAEGSV